eukprot:1511962-Amphidinium_carterae.1
MEIGSVSGMVAMASDALRTSIEAAEKLVAGGINGGRLELLRCLHSQAEHWYCVASMLRCRGCPGDIWQDELLPERAAIHGFACITQRFAAWPCLQETVEYADMLKDYGKTLCCFELDTPHLRGENLLSMALFLNQKLLGHHHPRTTNVAKLLRAH